MSAILDGKVTVATIFEAAARFWKPRRIGHVGSRESRRKRKRKAYVMIRCGIDNNYRHEILRESMTDRAKLTPEELALRAAGPRAELLALAGGDRTATMRPGNGSAPKKRRKMSAAWEVMIAITENARRRKGERIALQGRGERGVLWGGASRLDSKPAAAQPAPRYEGIAKLDS
jgi:hypothetical protein